MVSLTYRPMELQMKKSQLAILTEERLLIQDE